MQLGCMVHTVALGLNQSFPHVYDNSYFKKGPFIHLHNRGCKRKGFSWQTKVGHQAPIWYSLTSGSMSWLFHLAGKYSGWRRAASQFSCFQLRGKLIQMTFISQFWYILNTVFNTTVQTKGFAVQWPFLKKYIKDVGGHRDLYPKLNWKRKPKQKTKWQQQQTTTTNQNPNHWNWLFRNFFLILTGLNYSTSRGAKLSMPRSALLLTWLIRLPSKPNQWSKIGIQTLFYQLAASQTNLPVKSSRLNTVSFWFSENGQHFIAGARCNHSSFCNINPELPCHLCSKKLPLL